MADALIFTQMLEHISIALFFCAVVAFMFSGNIKITKKVN